MKKNEAVTNSTKKPFYKRKWFIILMVLFIIGTISNIINPPDDAKQIKEKKVEKTSKSEKKEEKKKIAKKAPKQKVDMKIASEESLMKLCKKQFKHKNKITVSYSASDASCLITIEDRNEYFSETTFVRDQYTRYINYCKKAYKMSNITSIQFDISVSMKDTKGNTSMENVMSIGMKKDVFDSYNWKNVIGDSRTITSAIDNGEFEISYIHPGIAKEVKWNKIYYGG